MAGTFSVTFTFDQDGAVTGSVTTTVPPPILTAITPSSIPANTPTLVTVTGSNFPLGSGTCTVNGQTTGFTVTNASSFQAAIPALP